MKRFLITIGGVLLFIGMAIVAWDFLTEWIPQYLADNFGF